MLQLDVVGLLSALSAAVRSVASFFFDMGMASDIMVPLHTYDVTMFWHLQPISNAACLACSLSCVPLSDVHSPEAIQHFDDYAYGEVCLEDNHDLHDKGD